VQFLYFFDGGVLLEADATDPNPTSMVATRINVRLMQETLTGIRGW
jgi:hypothetical protein